MKQSEKGYYYWVGTFDREYEQKQYRIVAGVVGGLCIGLILLGFCLCGSSGDWSMFPAFVLPCLFAMVITAVVIAIFKAGPGSKRAYGMSERGIWMGSGRSRADFYFETAKHLIITKTYLEPVQKIGSFRIYVPEEDMPFVKNFVFQHLPPGCDVEDRTFS